MPLDMDKIPGPVKRPDHPDVPPENANAIVWEELKVAGQWFNFGVDKLVRLRRARVPGGWFVVMGGSDGRTGWFYPDPEHRWNGTSLK